MLTGSQIPAFTYWYSSTYWYYMHTASENWELSAVLPICRTTNLKVCSSCPIFQHSQVSCPGFLKVLPRKDAFNVFVVVIARSVGNIRLNCLLTVSVFHLPTNYLKLFLKYEMFVAGLAITYYERVSMYFRQA